MIATREGPPPKENQPLPPLAHDVVQIAICGVLEGQETRNLFYYRNNAAIGTVNDNDLTGILDAFMTLGSPGSDMPNCTATSWHFDRLEAFSITKPSLVKAEKIINLNGVVPGKAFPSTVSATISRYANFRGQCGRGRISVPAVPLTWAVDSVLIEVGFYTGMANNMKRSLLVNFLEWFPVIYSRGPKPGFQEGSADIIRTIVRPVLGTCRRRKLDRGI